MGHPWDCWLVLGPGQFKRGGKLARQTGQAGMGACVSWRGRRLAGALNEDRGLDLGIIRRVKHLRKDRVRVAKVKANGPPERLGGMSFKQHRGQSDRNRYHSEGQKRLSALDPRVRSLCVSVGRGVGRCIGVQDHPDKQAGGITAHDVQGDFFIFPIAQLELGHRWFCWCQLLCVDFEWGVFEEKSVDVSWIIFRNKPRSLLAAVDPAWSSATALSPHWAGVCRRKPRAWQPVRSSAPSPRSSRPATARAFLTQQPTHQEYSGGFFPGQNALCVNFLV